MLVLSSPSGAGKTTLTRKLLESDSSVSMSVSATTRARRPNEVEGRDYLFVAPDKFEQMVSAGEFLEHATVFDHRYGTPRQPVLSALGRGRDVLFDIDWQGAQQVRERLGDDVVSIFVLPPSMKELRARLERRAEDSAATIESRLEAARHEIERWRNYHYVIVNDDLQRAYRDVLAIIAAERLKVRRAQAGVAPFVESLVHG